MGKPAGYGAGRDSLADVPISIAIISLRFDIFDEISILSAQHPSGFPRFPGGSPSVEEEEMGGTDWRRVARSKTDVPSRIARMDRTARRATTMQRTWIRTPRTRSRRTCRVRCARMVPSRRLGSGGDGEGTVPVERGGRNNAELLSRGPRVRPPLHAKRFWQAKETQEILALALPAFGSLLADPLMSLIDTACVGRASTLSLAALGPNTSIFNFVFQMFSFLSTGTTGLIAKNLALGKKNCAKRTLGTALGLALGIGVTVSALVQVAAPSLLRIMGANNAMVTAGTSYLRIRSLAVPAVLTLMVAQGACLGRQDAKTPLFIFMFAGLLNCVGDLWLVLPQGLSLGLPGAAIATLVSQVLAACIFVGILFHRGHLPKTMYRLKWEDTAPFLNVSGMLLLGSLCRMGVYTLMTVTATSMGMVTIASHQIALQVFWFLTYFVDPLFVAATSFIARDIKKRRNQVARMAWTLISCATASGIVLGVLSGGIPVAFGEIFTGDPEIISSLRNVSVLMGVSQLFSSVVLVAEGILIGAGELGYLAKIHCFNFVVLALYLAAVKTFELGLPGIWCGILINQVLRLLQHFSHVKRQKGTLANALTAA